MRPIGPTCTFGNKIGRPYAPARPAKSESRDPRDERATTRQWRTQPLTATPPSEPNRMRKMLTKVANTAADLDGNRSA